MEKVTLKIKSKGKLQRFLAFINDLDYVEVVEEKAEAKDSEGNEDDFFSIKGMWAGRDVTVAELRAQA